MSHTENKTISRFEEEYHRDFMHPLVSQFLTSRDLAPLSVLSKSIHRVVEDEYPFACDRVTAEGERCLQPGPYWETSQCYDYCRVFLSDVLYDVTRTLLSPFTAFFKVGQEEVFYDCFLLSDIHLFLDFNPSPYVFDTKADAWLGGSQFFTENQLSQRIASTVSSGGKWSILCGIGIDGDAPREGHFRIDIEGLLGDLVWHYSYDSESQFYEARLDIGKNSSK